jgi:hypothetical protein
MAYDQATRQAQSQAYNILDNLRNIYRDAKSAQDALTLYQAGTDPTFNAAVNGLYPAGELTTLGQMLNHLNTLATAWEGDNAYRAALNLPPL